MALKVLLYDLPVATLMPTSDGYEFRFDASYVSSAPRPVLGRAFEDMPPSVDVPIVTHDFRLPPWFRNLLPEGVFRAALEEAVHERRDREYYLLRRLGDDLPGAVAVIDDGLDEERPFEPEYPPRSVKRLRVSLAGMQPKLSILRSASKVTVPVAGQGGRWIAKLPGQLKELPENEFAMLSWARDCGVFVPDIAKCLTGDIEGLPDEWRDLGGEALLVERFDRRVDDRRATVARIHQEDFAQVFGLHPEEKYEDEGIRDEVSYESIASIVRRVCGVDDYRALLERLAFMVLCGNGDAHPKNWALYYPDKLRPRLAPAYDLVCTIAFAGHPSRLALALMGQIDMARITLDTFAALARAINADPEEAVGVVRSFSAKAREHWRRGTARAVAPPSVVRALDAHLGQIAL